MPKGEERDPYEVLELELELGAGRPGARLDRNGAPVAPRPVGFSRPPVKDLEGALKKESKRVRVETYREVKGSPLRLPTREELAALALDIYRLSLDHKKAFIDRSGNAKQVVQPDYRSACEALRVAASVAGITGASSREAEQRAREQAEAELDAEAALDKLRADISKRVMTVEGPRMPRPKHEPEPEPEPDAVDY